MTPLAKTQPQFGKGRIVRAKTSFEMPSTMKNTINNRVMARRPSPGWRMKKHANDHRQDDRDQLEPEMRYVLSADQTYALHYAANDQYPAEEQHHGDRGQNWINQCENAAENHKSALNKIPK